MIDSWHFHSLHVDQEYVTVGMLPTSSGPLSDRYLEPLPTFSRAQKKGFGPAPKRVSPSKKYADRLVNYNGCSRCEFKKKRIEALASVAQAINDFARNSVKA